MFLLLESILLARKAYTRDACIFSTPILKERFTERPVKHFLHSKELAPKEQIACCLETTLLST